MIVSGRWIATGVTVVIVAELLLLAKMMMGRAYGFGAAGVQTYTRSRSSVHQT